MTFIVKDALGKMQDHSYYTAYHAEWMARALNLNEGTHYSMYYGSPRFTVEAR
jgi:hypothetical protein